MLFCLPDTLYIHRILFVVVLLLLFKSLIKYHLFYVSSLEIEPETSLSELFIEVVLSENGSEESHKAWEKPKQRQLQFGPTVFWFLEMDFEIEDCRFIGVFSQQIHF